MIKLLISSLLVISLTGCAQSETLRHRVTSGLPSAEVPTTISVTSTLATPILSDARLKIQCSDIVATAPANLTSNGILVLDSRVSDDSGRYKNFDTYFIDMVTKAKVQVAKPYENLEDFAVSPDRKWIAYSDSLFDANGKEPTLNLVVATGNNQVYKVLPWETEWQSVNWLDDQHLIITTYRPATPGIYATLESISFLLLNPFTGERKILQRDFPNIYDVSPLPNWGGWIETVYDPTMTRAVYLQGDVSGPFYYVLWDTQQNKEVSNIQIIGDLNVIPRWSPDGEQFAFAHSLFSNKDKYPAYELYSVEKNGKLMQLTHLADYYPRVYIDDFSWSPDGLYIAFWFSFWNDTNIGFDAIGNRYLAVLDITSGWVTNYCIHGENDATIGLRSYPPPLWSPDSKQIVLESQNSKNTFQTVLIDLQQGRAFELAENLAPVGWIKLP